MITMMFLMGGMMIGNDICQKIYATAVLRKRILRKKRVNRDISQFAKKGVNGLKWPNSRQKSVNASQRCTQYE